MRRRDSSDACSLSGCRAVLVDGDDTLWENNIHFEAVIDSFCCNMVAHGVSERVARDVLFGIQKQRVAKEGYGSAGFALSLGDAVIRLMGTGTAQTSLAEDLAQRASRIRELPIELLAGVVPALELIRTKFDVVLCTKGDTSEQRAKVEASGLKRLFSEVVIMKEKDKVAYQETVEQLSLRPEECVMIGNSPRSDVIVPLSVGIKPIFVRHPRTSGLELSELPPTPSVHSYVSLQEASEHMVGYSNKCATLAPELNSND